MSTVNVADVIRLARVESANLFEFLVLGSPEVILEVTAQRSGFNWELSLRPGFSDEPIELEYFPYLVLETKTGPGWPMNPDTGHGPVVPPTTLHTVVTHLGAKGVEVVGQGFRKKLDYPKATA